MQHKKIMQKVTIHSPNYHDKISMNNVYNCSFNYDWLSMSNVKITWKTGYHKLYVKQKFNDTTVTFFYQLFVAILHLIHLEYS